MRFKSKYNIGDIVLFYNETTQKTEIGKIRKLRIDFSYETNKQELYFVEKVKTDIILGLDERIKISEHYIEKRLNKRVFEKEFAKICAKESLKNE